MIDRCTRLLLDEIVVDSNVLMEYESVSRSVVVLALNMANIYNATYLV